VNFDAITKYFALTGGEALLPEKHSTSLNICAFLQPQSAGGYPATSNAFQVVRDSFGPDDLFALLGWLNPHMEEMSIPQILAVLRLSHWDPVALVRLFPVLVRQLATGMVWRADLRQALKKIWSNHFAMKADDNVVAFYCGVILLELKFFEDALEMFMSSQQLLGRSAATSYNLALCQLGMARSSEALELVKEACVQDSTFEPARLLHLKLERAKSLD
jgi:tetratricopeptide (TPR) repeat protein